MKLGAKKRRAVITIVHNEPVFLPIWLNYYSRFFRPEDIYVLDNDTMDGSTERDGFVRIPVHHDSVDHTWMVDTVQDLQHELLDRYDVVLVTDVDEIVTPTPEWGTLGEYIDEFSEMFVTCVGYEILHMIDREGPYDPSRPILDQRGYWFANGAYNKSALATEPMSWVPGFHHRTDERLNYDPDLRLIHLHRMDFDICHERHRIREARAWNETDVDERWAYYNRTVDEVEFESWFYGDIGFDDPDAHITVERIPESFRGLF
jgi:Glycosyl transferase family 2